jgi:hypothetical protein
MPEGRGFVSKRQLATCFSRQLSAEAKGEKWNWDCLKNLKETPNPICLPSLKGYPAKCRGLYSGEKIVTPIYQGPRGGYFFLAKGVKVYVPKNAIAYAKRKYGFGGRLK